MTALINVSVHLEVCYGRISSAKNVTLTTPSSITRVPLGKKKTFNRLRNKTVLRRQGGGSATTQRAKR